MPDSVPPTVDGTDPSTPATGATNVSTSANLIITFSEAMDPDTITNNTSNTTCSGFTFQLSKNNFSSCIQMNGSPSVSNGNKTFTFDPASSLDKGQEYKFRITVGVEDKFGNNLSVQIEITFTTASG